MLRFLPLSFQHRVLLVFLLLLNVPFALTGYLAKDVLERNLLAEKEHKLFTIAHILDARLGSGGFQPYLAAAGAEKASREQQIAALNKALSDMTNEIGLSSEGLGVGFYSRALDAIITYGPSEDFKKMVGVSIPDDHPGRIVMSDNVKLARAGSMVRGDILNAMLPIARGDKVIGYIWANELSTDIANQLAQLTRNIFFIMLACFILTVALLVTLSRRMLKDVGKIISGVKAMQNDLSERIDATDGELGEVANSINAMAENISHSNEKTQRAFSVLSNILSNVDTVVYVSDPATKELVYYNDCALQFMGKEDVRGLRCHEALHDRTDPCPFCPQSRLFDSEGTPTFAPVHREAHNKRMNRDFHVIDRLITWHDGRILHMEVATDITERNALAVAEAANLAQRDFLARMSHEIRTPMNGVLGMTRLALQAGPPPEQREYLKKIQSSADILLGIINDILDFSRIEAGKLSIEKHPFNMREMTENIRELILPRVQEHNLDLIFDIAPDVPEFALGDGLRLSQVLLNLLGNASKFTLQGAITLTMKAQAIDDTTFQLHCAIQDSGIGMTPEQLQGLFKPFSQADKSTSRKFGGTGLGLSISKALVELMGGEIQATSAPGTGSTFSFHIRLEKAEQQALEHTQVTAPWANARHEGCHILLVEDNLINQEIALAVLDDLGAEVSVANNGQEAVEAFMKNDFDLILMDVRMPVMDGYDATRHIRGSSKHDAATIPIVAMTANAMKEDRESTKEAGMNEHLAKPLDVDELKRILFELMGQKK